MNITAKITGIEYKVICTDDLPEVKFSDMDINSAPSCFFLSDKKYNYGISKWVSPKRTRSYPFERIYNSLNVPKRITVIPVIKDEGAGGDRDFIQWDTISLMSLLDVYVILAYYENAEAHSSKKDKITNQRFDNNYVKNKISEISNYHSSALHWNLKEIRESLPQLMVKVHESYSRLGEKLKINFHNITGIETFLKQFDIGVTEFMNASRNKARHAQHREKQTVQPKEFLSTLSKATITIENFLGGKYFFTTDEIAFRRKQLFLIEGKHSKNSKLPSLGDIKDGLLKMVLYNNLSNVKVNETVYDAKPILKLTSSKIIGRVTSLSTSREINSFKLSENFTPNQIRIIDQLFLEAKSNSFKVMIEGVKND